ncbi:ATP-binding protein [Francisella sp. SYW-2]|uniref:ATP-binding protein n=1 Tax=Francisella sp. SYW-2 TaxID=2610886 RepID=UPI00123C9051|nr:ATP-binding protein [Francisella sp. SYW-2]
MDTKIRSIIAEHHDLTTDNDKSDSRNKNITKKCDEFVKNISDRISYIHIPTDINISDFSKIEEKEIQKLTGKNIRDEIQKIITTGKLSAINKELGKLIETISTSLENYKYTTKTSLKNITMPNIVSKIIDEYFSLRHLVKEDTDTKQEDKVLVQDLSSGEKRKALVELSEAFLKTQKPNNKIIIFAIDEPEASLNNRGCLKQFERIKNIQKLPLNIQVITSTHWYGHLPILDNGLINFIYNDKNNKVGLKTYDAFSFRETINQEKKEQNSNFSNDISIKSINDLVLSIISSLQIEKSYSWLICEGTSDKLYFQHYLKKYVSNGDLIILPIGGAKEVTRIFEHLCVFTKDIKHSLKSKVLCLTDTDKSFHNFDCKVYDGHNKIFLKRLCHHENSISIKDYNMKSSFSPLEIEDCLDETTFLETLKYFAKSNDNIKAIVEADSYNTGFFNNITPLQKSTIDSFLNANKGNNKVIFANKYIEIETNYPREISWINELEKILF